MPSQNSLQNTRINFEMAVTLVFILIVIVILEYIVYAFRDKVSPDNFMCVLILLIFICGLVFHSYFWRFRKNTPKQVLYVIDYIYVGTASASLLFASQNLNIQYSEDRDVILSQIEHDADVCVKKIDTYVKNSDGNKYVSLRDDFVDVRSSARSRIPDSAILKIEPALKKADDDLKALPQNDELYAFVSVLARTANKLQLRSVQASLVDLYRRKPYIYILLAIGLALRITKTTMELMGWYKENS